MNTRARAHQDATHAAVELVAQRLQGTLGQQITAYAVGIGDPRSIGRYARGERKPSSATERRLRQLFEIAQILLARETPESVRAWMLGSHPSLGDRSPLELLRAEHERSAERSTARVANLDPLGWSPSYRTVLCVAQEFVRAV